MARDRLGLDYAENMSDATTCSCLVSSVEKCSVRSCGSMFQEPFFLHPPGSRPRDGLYINPMSGGFARPKDSVNGSTSNGSESFYLHSPHELVYTRITHLFDATPSLAVVRTSSGDRASSAGSRSSGERKDETLTVKVDVHMNNGAYKPTSNGATPASNGGGGSSSGASSRSSSVAGSPRSEHGAKADSGSEHAYEQINIRPEAPPPPAASSSPKYVAVGQDKRLGPTDSVSEASSRSHNMDRRYSRSSSASESSNMSSEVHYSSATSTPPLSRNSSNERMNKSPKLPEIPIERKNSTTSSTRAESENETKPLVNGPGRRVVGTPSGPSIFRPPPPPPPPPPEIEEVVIVTSKVVESSVKEEKRIAGQSTTTTQEQKCEATITTISATNKCAASRALEPAELAAVGGGQATSADDELRSSTLVTSASNGTTTTTSSSACQVTAHLVNRHMVLPFIPPKFAAQSADSDTLLKPSEYLRSICKAAANGPTSNTGSLAKARSVDNLDLQGRGHNEEEEEEEEAEAATHRSETGAEEDQARRCSGPPPPPLPPPPANGFGRASPLQPATGTTIAETRQAQQLQQPLATISIQDLTSVQLRRTNVKMHATKTFSAPPNRSVSMTNVSEAFFVQKTDLIAELKQTKDIPGIKKLKVERAQNEKSQEQNLISEISKNFNASNFVDQIPEKDSAGNVIPIWKRQMLARKAAERAKKELEERIARENEEKRIQAIPPWKRQLLARKDSENKSPGTSTTQPATVASCSSQKIETPVIRKKEPIVEIASSPATETKVCEETKVAQAEDKRHDANDEEDSGSVHIIPWRAQLRKTNSKLNILD